MARGEAFVTCPQCNSQSRIPVSGLQRDNYHCSRCGNRIPLSTVHVSVDGERRPSPSRAKRPFQKHKRR